MKKKFPLLVGIVLVMTSCSKTLDDQNDRSQQAITTGTTNTNPILMENNTNSSAGLMNDEEASILLTVFLRHDQTKNLEQIHAIQRNQGFYQQFPPAGTQIVSWHVAMGIGQIVTLKVPASKLAAVNLSLERTAWGAFQTEFYPTYDLYPVIRGQLTNNKRVEN